MLFKAKDNPIEKRIVDSIRCLGIDMINESNSGHPGIVLGAAPIIYTVYAKHLRFSSSNTNWLNRDRFIMSAGHGSALLYATLFLSGFNLTIDDLKEFRKLGSLTPGHPEYKVTPGVDMTTGPLGQGFSSAVGMAIAEEYLRNYYQKKKVSLIDYNTYVLCSDGDLMEGVSYEAASLAGTLKLNHLIVLYDSNNICLDGKTEQVFTENVANRFQALNWNVIVVQDGEDLNAIDSAIEKAKSSDKPNLIVVNTVIGKYSKIQGTKMVHGTPLEAEDITNIKEVLGVRDIPFTVSMEASETYKEMLTNRLSGPYQEWLKKFEALDDDLKTELIALQDGNTPINLEDFDYDMTDNQSESLRISAGKVLNALALKNDLLLGGAADVSTSTNTYLEDRGDFSSSNRLGRNIWFGVREHAMGAILNGMALSGLKVFGSTYLAFSDYLKPAMRMAALMNLPVTYIFTHDSISVGKDGPTHQPVEQLVSLRATPNFEVFRPADINEIIGVYQYVMKKTSGPSAIVIGRNEVVPKETTSIKETAKGAYIVRQEETNLAGIIIASGEELDLALETANRLMEKGLDLRVVSVPSLELYKRQDKEYREMLFPLGTKVFVIELSSSYSWHEFVYNDKYLITLDKFGKSGNKEDLYQEFGFDIETIVSKIEGLLK